jgi:hypothetical protein
VFDRILVAIGKDWAAGDYMHLLNERDFRKRLADVGVADYRFLRNRLAGFTIDFVAAVGAPEATVPAERNTRVEQVATAR